MGGYPNPDFCAEQMWGGELSRAADDRLSNLGGAVESLREAKALAEMTSYRLGAANKFINAAANESIEALDSLITTIDEDVAALQMAIDNIDQWDAEQAHGRRA